MYLNYVLLKGLCKKCCFRRFFDQKVKASTCLWRCFCACRLARSHMTPSRPTGVQGGRGVLSQVVLPASYWSHGSYIWLPAARLCTFFLLPSGLGFRSRAWEYFLLVLAVSLTMESPRPSALSNMSDWLAPNPNRTDWALVRYFFIDVIKCRHLHRLD